MISIPVRFIDAETKVELPIEGYAVVEQHEIDLLRRVVNAAFEYWPLQDNLNVLPVIKATASAKLRAAMEKYEALRKGDDD